MSQEELPEHLKAKNAAANYVGSGLNMCVGCVNTLHIVHTCNLSPGTASQPSLAALLAGCSQVCIAFMPKTA